MDSERRRQLDCFRKASQSLKLYRRAELVDEEGGGSLVEALYVDPLPGDHVLQTILRSNTTFIIGRKGTGKSTVFQRAQYELLKHRHVTSAYVDIKTVFESSNVEGPAEGESQAEGALSPAELRDLLLYRNFLRSMLREIRAELGKRTQSAWDRLKEFVSGTQADLFKDLDALLDEIDTQDFISVARERRVARTETTRSAAEDREAAHIGASAGATPKVEAGVEGAMSRSTESGLTESYSDILLRTFDVTSVLLRLKELLQRIRVGHLYVFIDDFSELPEAAMRIVVDTLLAPLNNWSDELIKFKVAAYPGRIYFGKIDKTKIDEINLDLFRLYGATTVGDMEDKAIEFTRRLIEKRIHHFCETEASSFLPDTEDAWRLLFYATMANPRNIGYLLYYLQELYLIYDKEIGLRSIREAARKYYEEKIEPYFAMSKFLHESFDERSSIFSLKELLEAFVKRSMQLKRNPSSEVMKGLEGSPPTSHFHIPVGLDSVLASLELNFFLTKYYEMKDRDGRPVSVFALNFGLCQKHSIEFGRPRPRDPEHARRYRLYFVERSFDYTGILNEYIQRNQEIVCGNCGAKHDLSQLPALQVYGMLCPTCREGICEVRNLSRRYEEVIRGVDPELLLPPTELGIIATLNAEDRRLFAKDIASELDCSYQLVGKRAKILDERGLVERNAFLQGRRTFEITDRARELYFTATAGDELDPGPLDPVEADE